MLTSRLWTLLFLVNLFGWAAACQAQDCQSEDSCLVHFEALALARNGPLDLLGAQRVLEQGCTQSETGMACSILANFIFAGLLEGSVQDAIPLWEKACRLGNGTACTLLAREAVLLRAQYGVAANVAETLEQACRRGEERVCVNVVGSLHSSEKFAAYPKLCEDGRVEYCLGAGWLARQESHNKEKVAQLFYSSCQAGFADACFALTDTIIFSQYVESNILGFLLRSCELGHFRGCQNSLALLPAEEVYPAFEKSCLAAGHPKICGIVARYHDPGQVDVYAMLFARACLLGDMESCLLAANDGQFFLVDAVEVLANLRAQNDPKVDALLSLYKQFLTADLTR